MTRIISLRSAADFERVLRSGKRASSGAISCAVHRRGARSHAGTPLAPASEATARIRPEAPGPRFGFTVTRRVGGAVARNRAKRLLREAARAVAEHVPADADVVVGARAGAIGKSYQEIASDLRTALTKAGIPCS